MRLFTAAAMPVGGQQTVTGGGDIGLAESEPDVA
jgi:hypothetical protein